MVDNVMSFIRTPPRVKCKMIEKQEAASNSTRSGVQGGLILLISLCCFVVPRMMIVTRGKGRTTLLFCRQRPGLSEGPRSRDYVNDSILLVAL